MRQAIVWARLFGVSGAVIETVELSDGLGVATAGVRVRRGQSRRCGVCGRRCSLYDRGEGRRRWRAPDLGTTIAFVEAEAPRVNCPKHGVVVARVPWARHDSRFTRDFEDQCAWLAVHVSKTTLAEMARIAWRTVGRIIGRVVEERSAEVDRLDGLSEIGIDEVSFRRGQRYLTVVVNHQTARVVWVEEGRDDATLDRTQADGATRRVAEMLREHPALSLRGMAEAAGLSLTEAQDAIERLAGLGLAEWRADAGIAVAPRIIAALEPQGVDARRYGVFF